MRDDDIALVVCNKNKAKELIKENAKFKDFTIVPLWADDLDEILVIRQEDWNRCIDHAVMFERENDD